MWKVRGEDSGQGMDFVNRIQILCFAASYAVGIVLEWCRLYWPTRPIRWAATTAGLAGLFAHTLYLVQLGSASGSIPLANQFESLLLVSWLVALFYIYWILHDRRSIVGLFILPATLGIICFAGFLSQRGERGTGQSILALIHGLFFLAGTVAVILALVMATMYLFKLRRLRTGNSLDDLPRPILELPSLERLDNLNRIAIYSAWPLLTLGLLLGFLLGSLSLWDPKVISTVIGWGLFTFLAHYRFQPGNRGRRVAVLTLIAGGLVLLSVLGDPFFGTDHQAVRPEAS